MMKKTLILGGLALLCFATTRLQAETFHLKNGQRLQGELLHFYQGVFRLQTPSGQERSLAQADVLRIDLAETKTTAAQPSTKGLPAAESKQPKAKKQAQAKAGKEPKPAPNTFLAELSPSSDSPYATPKSTFETWREAAIKGDIDGMVECYATFRQNDIRKQLKKMNRKKRKEMQAATARTQFFPNEPFYQGERAMLEIPWKVDLHNDTQVLNFMMENGAWKIIQ